MNKFLIFTTRQLCYHSAGYFALCFARELERLGYDCEICELPEDGIGKNYYTNAYGTKNQQEMAISETAERLLEGYLEKEYLGVIDFNSKLPRLILDDGSYYLDNIKAPFYNYILDNPLYHHSTLECLLKNYNVILVDKNHCNYVSRYYPHVNSVLHLPLGASELLKKEYFENKQECILFTGTYREGNEYIKQIDELGGQAAQDMHEMLDYMQKNLNCTMEGALRKVLSQRGQSDISDRDFKLLMNYYYPVEMAMRNFCRENMITALLKAGLPVKIVGDWWENYKYSDCPNLTLEAPVPFDKSYEKIAECAVLADSSPFFKAGVHDRVFAGMANHTAVLTDNNSYIQKHFVEKGLVEPYSLTSEESLVKAALHLLEDKNYRQNMTDKAYKEYLKNYTWEKVVKKFIDK